MSKNEFDYLIVGQGLAGSVLSYLLMREGKKVLVIDQFNANSSSQVAAGLVNPVTGRRVVKSWMADTLLPFADEFYDTLEKEFSEIFYHRLDVLEVVHTIKDLNEWISRISEQGMRKYFSKDAPENMYREKISEFRKLIRISSSAWMNIPLFVDLCRKRLKESSLLLEESFDYLNFKIEDNLIEYKIYKSKRIIFCEGFKSFLNPLWNWLPFVPAKGEILLIECKNLPEDFILISGIFLIPVGNHKFRVGSTYEWNFSHEDPTEEGKIKLLTQLNNLLKIPFDIIGHHAGVRPTVKDRRPLIGHHPEYKNVFIFNGMGTKGVQLVPFFGDQFVKFLEGKEKLMAEVNVERFNI